MTNPSPSAPLDLDALGEAAASPLTRQLVDYAKALKAENEKLRSPGDPEAGPEWMKDKPTKPGWYWVRIKVGVRIVEIRTWTDGSLYPDWSGKWQFTDEFQWAGPIPEPGAALSAPSQGPAPADGRSFSNHELVSLMLAWRWPYKNGVNGDSNYTELEARGLATTVLLEWLEDHPPAHPVPAAPAAPVDYTPLVAEEIIKSGDECWADKVGPWTKVSEARVGESYKPWNGDTGWHLPMRRPSHPGSASTGAQP